MDREGAWKVIIIRKNEKQAKTVLHLHAQMHTRTIKAVVGTTNTQNSSTAAIFGVLPHHKFYHAAAVL